MMKMVAELIHIKTMLEIPINVDQGNTTQVNNVITYTKAVIHSTRYQVSAILAGYSVIDPMERYAEAKFSKLNAVLVPISSTDYVFQIDALV